MFAPIYQRYSELRTSDRFDDPLAYPGFGLGENMIFPKYELKLSPSSYARVISENIFFIPKDPKSELLKIKKKT